MSALQPEITRLEKAWLWLIRLTIVLVMAAVAFVYPLNVPRFWTDVLFGPTIGVEKEFGFLAAWRAFFEFGYSPLLLKETFMAWGVLLLAGLWGSWKLLFPQRGEGARLEVWALLLFWLYAIVSMFRAPHFGLDMHCLAGGMNLSFGLIFFLALLDLPPSRSFRKGLLVCIIAIGGIIMAVSLAQAIEPLAFYAFRILKRIESPFNRNLYGSLIGHNTGAASFGMGPFFIALGFFFHVRGWKKKSVLALFLVIALYFFFITQSRAVWLLLFFLTPLFLYGLHRLVEVSLPLRALLAGAIVLLFLVLVQMLPLPGNFLHIEKVDYKSRLTGLTPRAILEGTRLRIAAVSMRLIAQKPILGHGLMAFPVLYPKAQSDYFVEHPDSIFKPTDKLTQRAHNDPLQLVLETGLLGLALAITTLALFLRRAWRIFQRSSEKPDRLTRYCLFFGFVSLLLHSFMDFPFHIASSAIYFIVYLALIAREEQPIRKSQAPPSIRLPRPIGIALSLLLMALLVQPLANPFALLAKRLRADRFFTKAALTMTLEQNRAESMGGGPAIEPLEHARAYFRESIVLMPLNMETLTYAGLCDLQIAMHHIQQRAAQPSLQHPAAIAHLHRARGTLASGIAYLERATRCARPTQALPGTLEDYGLGPRMNHSILYTLARGWRMHYVITEPRQQADIRRAFRFCRLALRYSPGYRKAVEELLDMMDHTPFGSQATREKVLRDFAFFNPNDFMEWVYANRAQHIYLNEGREATRLMTKALEYHPRPTEQKGALQMLTLDSLQFGTPEEAAAVIQFQENHFPEDDLSDFKTLFLFKTHRFAEVELVLREDLAQDPDNLNKTLLLSDALLMQKRQKEALALFRKAVSLAESPAAAYFARARNRQGAALDALAVQDYQEAFFSSDRNVQLPATALYILQWQADTTDWAGFDRTRRLLERRMPLSSRIRNKIREMESSRKQTSP